MRALLRSLVPLRRTALRGPYAVRRRVVARASAASASATLSLTASTFAALALALPRADDPLASAADRAPIAGMRFVASRSELTFAGHESRPHRLEATYLFPDRARWSLRAIGEDQERAARRMRFRVGDRVFALEPGKDRSVELAEKDAHQALLQLELRRAALLWPDGFAWTGDGDRRQVALEGVGTLVASFDPQADGDANRRPIAFASKYADGSPCERYAAVRWSADARWPLGWELWLGDRKVWTEQLAPPAHRGDLLDVFFVPPDRRVAEAAETGALRVDHSDLPRRAVRRRALAQPSADVAASWAAVAALAGEWRTALEAAGRADEVAEALELDDEGRVVAVLARIDEPDALPEELAGTALADGPALVQDLPPGVAADALRLRALRARLPLGARAGAPELRREGGGARLVLPLLPADD